MKTPQEYYSTPHKGDYRLYILDCLEEAKKLMGADGLLEALTLSLSVDTLADKLQYINRVYELHID